MNTLQMSDIYTNYLDMLIMVHPVVLESELHTWVPVQQDWNKKAATHRKLSRKWFLIDYYMKLDLLKISCCICDFISMKAMAYKVVSQVLILKFLDELLHYILT